MFSSATSSSKKNGSFGSMNRKPTDFLEV
jgi:hypothetical protein